MSYVTRRIVTAVLGIGLSLSMLGHGLFAAFNLNEKFPGLLSGSLKNTLGVQLSDETAVSIVRAIGVVDVSLVVVVALIVVGVVRERGVLARLATTKLAIGVFAYAAVWGFVTAASRPVSAGIFWPEVLDLVERGPNFMLPAALVVLTVAARRRARPRPY